jgi:hypothetical protein
MIDTILLWLWNQVWPNIFASALCFVGAWFWKIRPHFRHVKAAHAAINARLDVQDATLGITSQEVEHHG